MATIVIGVNPRTGQQELRQEEEGAQYAAQLTASTYGDMLHDQERNAMYEAAITASVKAKGQDAVVLDIGTGTGLLALMAARAGARHVFACEVFPAMCAVARECIAPNGMNDVITLIQKRSTDMTVGPEGDMPLRADIIVMEIFDSELIGEGVLGTMKHALEHLAKSDVTVIPSEATVYAQLCWSPTLDALHLVDGATVGRRTLKSRPQAHATPSPLECHLDTLLSDRTNLSEVSLVKTFDFADARTLDWPAQHTVTFDLTPEAKTFTHVRAHMCFAERHWRQHWQPCVYTLPSPAALTPPAARLAVRHDEYAWAFSPTSDGLDAPPDPLAAPLPRRRRAALHDASYWRCFERALEVAHAQLQRPLRVLCVGDASFLPVVAAQLDVVHRVYVLEQNFLARAVTSVFPDEDAAKVKVIRASAEDVNVSFLDNAPADVLLAEPSYLFADLPWHTICFLFERLALQSCLTDDAVIIPSRFHLMVQPAVLRDYHTLRQPADNVSGFDLSAYDRACALASWETVFLPNNGYRLLAAPRCILDVDLTSQTPLDAAGEAMWRAGGREQSSSDGDVAGHGGEAVANCVLAWVDFTLISENTCDAADTTSIIRVSNAPGALRCHTAVQVLERPCADSAPATTEAAKQQQQQQTSEEVQESAPCLLGVKAVFDPTSAAVHVNAAWM
ncbi:hypothetical protein PTSG_03146 [Salpingoeca rosetta]|uniref:Protein arginine N-methyltransferase n=1 Tax=Salpingoeca rosetta (strain ATCC 50818 / BSB-021) TaxID=946362 RepID=F2U4D2_SALR5|nr:uncharacterized protein PTSG_03146 [Salpingoeca rosetta]EGD82498.1 hypothetical protein PTSG_03146 [Salpingoeca rosetta]|eukprot:XP_004995734.1 hypothetical protein PTSG_03146 [Salpingoeca rosetta]